MRTFMMSRSYSFALLALGAMLAACGDQDVTSAPVVPSTTVDPIVVRAAVNAPAAVTGTPYTFDATANNTTFSDPRGQVVSRMR